MWQIELLKLFWIKLENLCIKKIKLFVKFYPGLEDKNILYENDEGTKTRIPFCAPFVEQRKDIDHLSALYSVKVPFELVHANIADIRFSSKSAVNPKYCFLFTSKAYVYTVKRRNLLSKKLKLFLSWYSTKERADHRKGNKTDLEFMQNEIKKLIKKYNVKMYSSRVGGGKAYAAKQKTREFKKLLFNSKCVNTNTSSKCFDSIN